VASGGHSAIFARAEALEAAGEAMQMGTSVFDPKRTFDVDATDHVIPCLIGRDAHQIEDIWQFLYRGAYWRRGPVNG